MKHRILIFVFLTLFVSYAAQAGPVHDRMVLLEQPDGTVFRAKFTGDEYLRVKTTLDGCAIVQGGDGWWCYARYESDGTKVSTGVRVGDAVQTEVLTESRNIPFIRLSALASEARSRAAVDEVPIFRRMLDLESVKTKSDEDNSSAPIAKRGIVILAQFANLEFRYSREDFDRLLNSSSYSRAGATGSAKEYFEAQFNGRVQFTFDVSDIVTLSHNLDHYGGNVPGQGGSESDKAPAEMVIEACQLADEKVDFSLYDDDGDGQVDNVFVFFAGGDEAEGAGDDCLWSHAWYIKDGAGKNLILDGKRINRYACASELSRFYTSGNVVDYRLAGIGTFCHEYSHTLGLQDMYDTDYEGSGGESEALWDTTSLMDGGNHNNESNTPPFFNAIEREMMGLSQPLLIENDGVYRLDPINISGKYYRIDTDHEDEYYLLECRYATSWDAYIGGSGLLLYHIDRSDRNAGFSDLMGRDVTALERWRRNEVNCRPKCQCADLIEAMPGALSARNVFYPLENVNSIPSNKLIFWTGEECKFSINDIHWEGKEIVFSVTGGNEDTTPPDPIRLGYDRFQDAAIVSFDSSRPYSESAVVTWGVTGKTPQTMTVAPYQEGRYAAVLENLEPRTSYTVTVSFAINGVTGKQGVLSFMTTSYTDGHPYIYLKNVQRQPDGTFPLGSRLPLRVYNAVGAERVDWTLNGKSVKVDADGYYTLKEGGCLKAVVHWEDGSEDVIIKEIRITD